MIKEMGGHAATTDSSAKHAAGKLRTLHFFSALVLLFWTITLTGLLFWAVVKEKRQVLSYAAMEARANFNKDIALRNWASKRGGVYVPVSSVTPPSPYLAHIIERDIQTHSGRKLTLMNPAYMLRQVMEEYSELYGIKGVVTSLKPLNPINAPDPWESYALRQFEHGLTEISEITTIDGKPYLRYLKAFITEEGCLKCHKQQGYKTGDIRGGVGVSVPLQPYIDLKRHTIKALLYSYSSLWLLGSSGILFVNRFARRQLIRQQATETELAEEKERLELVLEGTGLGLWDWNPQTNHVIFDQRWANMMGYALAEIEPDVETWKARVHPDDLPFCYRDIQEHIDGLSEYYSNIHRMRHKDGTWRYILDRGKIVKRDAEGRPVRFTGTHTDISKLKETENALREKTEALREKTSELERLNEMLSHQAMYDGLTQVHNRRAFDKQLQEEWQQWWEQETVFSVLIADLDFFKRYNDASGHLLGDSCLKAVAKQLQRTAARLNGFTARYGGEEFALLLPGAEIEQAMAAAEQIRFAVEQLAIPHKSSDCAPVVTLSIGAASAAQVGEHGSCRDLLALADKALYMAKKNGRNRIAPAGQQV